MSDIVVPPADAWNSVSRQTLDHRLCTFTCKMSNVLLDLLVSDAASYKDFK